jgi:hypothetical protein
MQWRAPEATSVNTAASLAAVGATPALQLRPSLSYFPQQRCMSCPSSLFLATLTALRLRFVILVD